MSIQGQVSPVEVRFRERGYALLESHHEEGFFMDWRHDSFPKVLMFVGGEGILEMESASFAIRAPMVYLIPEGQHKLCPETEANRVGAGIEPAPPTPPGMRVRTGRFPSVMALPDDLSDHQDTEC